MAYKRYVPDLVIMWRPGHKTLTCDTLVSVDFALELNSLELVFQYQLIGFTDVFGSCRLGQQVVLQKRKENTEIVHDRGHFTDGEFSVSAYLLADLFKDRWLQLHALEHGAHNATLFPHLKITQISDEHIGSWTKTNKDEKIHGYDNITTSTMYARKCAGLTPFLLGSLWQQGPHLHESSCVDVSVLATEASLPDYEALGAGSEDQRGPLEHRPLVLGGRAAEQRGALLLGAQVGEHDRPEAHTAERVVVIYLSPLHAHFTTSMFIYKGDLTA